MADEITLAEQTLPTQEVPKPDIAAQIAGFEQRVTRRLDDMAGEIRAMKQEVIEPLAAAEASLPPLAAAAEATVVEGEGVLGTALHKAAALEHGAVDAVRSLMCEGDEAEAVSPPGELGLDPVPPISDETLPGPHVRAVEEARAQSAGVSIAA